MCIRVHTIVYAYARAYDHTKTSNIRSGLHSLGTACDCMCVHRQTFDHVCIRKHTITFTCMQLHAYAYVLIHAHTIVSAYALIRSHSTASTGVPDLTGYENFGRELARSKLPRAKQFETRADLLTFMRSTCLPATVGEMNDTSLYSVDGIADIWTCFEEPDGSKTLAIPLISKQCVCWIQQLVALSHAWALHGDGKHKLHIGRYILMTFGTHCLKWDVTAKTYRHSFRPLVYLFSQNHESVSAGRLAMVALQLVAVNFFGQRLESAVNISDRSDGLRSGMQYINIDHLAPDDEEVETPHCSDWAHIAVHYMKGRLIPKSNPYYGEIYYLLVRAYDNVRMHAVACSCICVHANTIVSAYAFIRLHSTASTGGHPPRALDRANAAARRHRGRAHGVVGVGRLASAGEVHHQAAARSPPHLPLVDLLHRHVRRHAHELPRPPSHTSVQPVPGVLAQGADEGAQGPAARLHRPRPDQQLAEDPP